MHAIRLRREQRNALPRGYQKVRYPGLITGALQGQKKMPRQDRGNGRLWEEIAPVLPRGIWAAGGSLAQARGSIARTLAFRTERMRPTAFTTASSYVAIPIAPM